MNGGGDHSHEDLSPIVGLLLTVTEAIAEVFLVCVAGYILARKGILDGKMRKMINKINVSLFTPALLFSKVAFALTPDKLAELWIVPVFFFIVTAVSALVAWALAKVFRIKRRSHVAFAIACGCFANSNSLPIALMQSLVVGLDAMKWGDDDTKDQMLGRALSYLTLYSTLGIVLRWSVGVKLLSAADDVPEESIKPKHVSEPPLEEEDEHEATERSPLLGRNHSGSTPSEGTLVAEPGAFTSDDDNDSHTPPKKTRISKRSSSRPGDFSSFPNTPRHRAPSLDSLSEEEDSGRHWQLPTSYTRHNEASSFDRFKRSFQRSVVKPARSLLRAILDFMTVPLYAALLSIIVACIPPVQSGLEDLKPVVGALKSAGNCSVPLTLVVLGGFMHQEDEPKPKTPTSAQTSSSKQRSGSLPRPKSRPSFMRRATQDGPRFPGESRTIFVALASRMLITPAILLPLLAIWSIKTNNVADDPVFLVTACLLCGSPPAVTLAQITEAAAGDFERLLSKTLLIAYTILTPPTTVFLVLGGIVMGEKQ